MNELGLIHCLRTYCYLIRKFKKKNELLIMPYNEVALPFPPLVNKAHFQQC